MGQETHLACEEQLPTTVRRRANVGSLSRVAGSTLGRHQGELTRDTVKSWLGGNPDGRTENHLGVSRGLCPPNSSSSGQNRAQRLRRAKRGRAEQGRVPALGPGLTGSNSSATTSGWPSNLTL